MSTVEVPTHFEAVKDKDPKERAFTPDDIMLIEYRRRILSTLGYFIGKDFKTKVELNKPGHGWHWDFEKNITRVDPVDLLEKPMDYLRFVMSHEAGHRRISRAEVVPKDEWKEPGFSFLMNAIEDPRDNNFVADAYPRFREQMKYAYDEEIDFEKKSKDDAEEKLGFRPKFIEAGFEYIRQWYKERQDQPFALSEEASPEVREVVESTLEAAQDSWWRYPSREEADSGEEAILQYAETSYRINRDRIWPDFKKLVDQDMQDQKIQEMMKEMMAGDGQQEQQQEGTEGGQDGQNDGQGSQQPSTPPGGIPENLQEGLSDQQKEELEKALENAQGQPQDRAQEQAGQPTGSPRAVKLSELSDDLKQKLQEYFDSLPEEKQKELAEKAAAALREVEEAINEKLRGHLNPSPEEQEKEKTNKSARGQDETFQDGQKSAARKQSERDNEALERYRAELAKITEKDPTEYERVRQEVLPLINELENKLREIFTARRSSTWETGFRSGKVVDIKRRIQEKAKSVPVVQSKAWQRRELPKEKDYAITLLVDLSGSMRQGNKMPETFKSVVALTEVLNRLSIDTEVIGFNDKLYDYQSFGTRMSNDVRAKMGTMPREIHTEAARWNDDGWAVSEASKRLERRRGDHKVLMVLSDGVPEPSQEHSGSNYELGGVVKRVSTETGQKVVGIGVGSGTEHVKRYYPFSVASIPAAKLPQELSALLQEVIERPDVF